LTPRSWWRFIHSRVIRDFLFIRDIITVSQLGQVKTSSDICYGVEITALADAEGWIIRRKNKSTQVATLWRVIGKVFDFSFFLCLFAGTTIRSFLQFRIFSFALIAFSQ
jgi:hypothetical protein